MSDIEADSPGEESGRPPATLAEHVVSNCRPQPAIPAVLVLFLMVLMPAMTLQASAAQGGWMVWVIAAGVVISCALAIAAGFCSFAPQALWIALALWAMQLFGRAGLPQALQQLLVTGIAVATLMIAVQAWRVATGRFVPTVVDETDEAV